MHIIKREVRMQQHLKVVRLRRSRGIHPLHQRRRRRHLPRPKNRDTILRSDHQNSVMRRWEQSKAANKDRDHQFLRLRVRIKKMSKELNREKDTARYPSISRDLTKKKKRKQLSVLSTKKTQSVLLAQGECQRANAKTCSGS